jgi:hypothetical protein
MKSATLPSFWSAYARLDEDTKRSARKAYRESQRQLLQKWRVSLRQIGYEVGWKRMTAG